MTIIAIDAHVDNLPDADHWTGLGVATLTSNPNGHQMVEGEGGRHVCFTRDSKKYPATGLSGQ